MTPSPEPVVEIRRAAEGDLDQVAAIERSLFGDPWSRRSFANLLAAPHAEFLVAAAAEGVAGYAVALIAGPDADLANLAVTRLLQRRGVGRQLLTAVLARARERGCTAMFLEVRASNAAAIALYRSAGFSAVGRRARYYAEPAEDAVVMRAGLEAVVGGSKDR